MKNKGIMETYQQLGKVLEGLSFASMSERFPTREEACLEYKIVL